MLSSHLFDGVIYPKFTEKTDFLENKPIKLVELKHKKRVKIEDYQILTLPIDHIPGSICFEITSKDDKKVFYTGDTGSDLSKIWIDIHPDLLIIDLTFPDKMIDTARNSKHLCPKLLKKELIEFQKLKGYLPQIYLIHLSPTHEEEIRGEIKKIANELEISINIASEGQTIDI